ncbi:MAG: hypothetical protein WC346_01420 [Methanogenium sp.]|jgi:hypothetical protein
MSESKRSHEISIPIASLILIITTLIGTTWYLSGELGSIKTNVAVLATELHAHMNEVKIQSASVDKDQALTSLRP